MPDLKNGGGTGNVIPDIKNGGGGGVSQSSFVAYPQDAHTSYADQQPIVLLTHLETLPNFFSGLDPFG